MSIKLNGWQRIWVIIGILLFIFTSVMFFSNTTDTKNRIYRSWANESIEQTLTLEEFEDFSVWGFRKAYPDFTDEEVIEKLQKNFQVRHTILISTQLTITINVS